MGPIANDPARDASPPADSPDLLTPGTSIIIPLILGCAVLGVAVLMAYMFARNQEEIAAREHAEKSRIALKQCLEAMKRQEYTTAAAAAEESIRLAEMAAEASQSADIELLATAYLFRAEARAGIGSTETLKAAAEDYTHCITFDPSNEDKFLAFYGRGQVRFRLGHTEAAEVDFSEALKINRYSAAVHRARAFARRRLHDLKGAEEDARRARELDDSLAPRPQSGAAEARPESGSHAATSDKSN